MQGLTGIEAAAFLEKYGRNELVERKDHPIVKIAKWLISPISLMLFLATVLSFGTGKLFDGYFIIFLIFVNAGVTIWQEAKADHAIEELKEHFRTQTRALRDGSWAPIDSVLLVPGDVIMLEVGNIVPADVTVLEETNFTINEASVTGESLPVEKANGTEAYSGTFVVTGRATAVVKQTGSLTYFGKTLKAGEGIEKRSILEADILRISFFLSALSLTAVVILSIALWLAKAPFLDTLTLDLSLVIAGIPISLPTVMTLIISLGVVELAKKHAVVRRISSLEDLANVNMLLSDKTGTLTRNLIAIERVIAYSVPEDDVLRAAFLAAEEEDHDPINTAIRQKATEHHIDVSGYARERFIPADSTRKRSTTIVSRDGAHIGIEIGAPQVILELGRTDDPEGFLRDVGAAAEGGFRAVAVAMGKVGDGNSERPRIIGILLLSDELRQDTKETLDFLETQGVAVSIVTGDHRAIAERVGGEVGIPKERIHSEVLPKDKLDLVRASIEKGYVVASTGDGINDLPALKTANVGIAVSNAVDALKSTADIILLELGLGVIKDAIIESRKIFQRLWSYSIYRISESFRLIITITILGLIYHTYPLVPVQLILLALLNDLPIISLSYDRVRLAGRPAHINTKDRILRSTLFGTVGVMNSMLLFFLLTHFTSLSWDVIQSIFFLKLTISGHLLIYLAHTEERWWRFLPSTQVIAATTLTQLAGTIIAGLGLFMARTPIVWIIFVWGWAFIWMQIGEWTKTIGRKHIPTPASAA